MSALLHILYEDEDLLAVNKPAGMLVVPGGGVEPEPTLLALVAEHLAPHGERPYVVHRLDRGTSGVILFARHAAAHRELNLAFDHRRVAKKYVALVAGDLEGDGLINVPLHPARRGKMRPAHRGEVGQSSRTHWKVVERFTRYTLLEIKPLTGRQHQIRVHLKSIGHPLAVDPHYGRKQPLTARDLQPFAPDDAPVLARTPLHATWLRLPALRQQPGQAGVPHPTRKERVIIEAPWPEDLLQALQLLRSHHSG